MFTISSYFDIQMNFRSAVPLDIHVIRIANRDYKLGSQEKSLTEKDYFEISNKLRTIWGDDAGWVQAVLFHNELQKPKNTSNKRIKVEKNKKLKIKKTKKEVKTEP